MTFASEISPNIGCADKHSRALLIQNWHCGVFEAKKKVHDRPDELDVGTLIESLRSAVYVTDPTGVVSRHTVLSRLGCTITRIALL